MIFSSSIYLFFFLHEKCCQMNMKKCHILEDYRFLAQKRPPEKKLDKNASLYLMNFDYLSYESNLLILGHPHICDREGGRGSWATTLYSVHRCIYIYIYTNTYHFISDDTYQYTVCMYAIDEWEKIKSITGDGGGMGKKIYP